MELSMFVVELRNKELQYNSYMKKFYTIRGRYGNSAYVYELQPDVYRLFFQENFYRVGYQEDGNSINFVDPSGGPFIEVGLELKELNNKLPMKKIVEIVYADDPRFKNAEPPKPGDFNLIVEKMSVTDKKKYKELLDKRSKDWKEFITNNPEYALI